jgi:hypothetical protein
METVYTQNSYDKLPFYIRFLLKFVSSKQHYDFETSGIDGQFSACTLLTTKTLFGTEYLLSKRDMGLNKVVPKRARVKW